MGMRNALAVMLLAGCVAAPAVERPLEGTPVIEASGFSGLFGGAFVRVWQGDVVELEVRDFSTREESLDRAVIPGAFAAATDAVARLGPAALRIPATEPGECTDYGEDIVRATPPVGTFAQAISSCPADDLSALTRAIFDIADGLGD
jgi:hypothetical protein